MPSQKKKMVILCSLVAFQHTIVAEDGVSASTRPVVLKMLERLPRYDTRVSYQYEAFVLHFLVENEVVYSCESAAVYENRIVYGFLTEVRDAFKTRYAGSPDRYPRPGDITVANCSSFAPALGTLRKRFNEDPHENKIDKIKDELNSTKQVMLENLDSIIDRGDRIDRLCDRTELLRDEAQGFQSNAHGLKRALIAHNLKIIAALLVVLVIVGLVIAMLVCGADFKNC